MNPLLQKIINVFAGLVVVAILGMLIAVLANGRITGATPGPTSAEQAQLKKLQGRVVLITGASGGIGRELVREAARLKMHVALTDIRMEKSEKLAAELNARGVKAMAVRADLAKPDERARLIRTVVSKFGRIDMLINNAGYAYGASALEMDIKDAQRNFEVNFWAGVDLTKRVIPIMKKNDGKKYIINMSSVFGLMPTAWPNSSMYTASKHAMTGWSLSISRELKASNINVKVVCPAGVRTNFLTRMSGPGADKASTWLLPTLRKGDPPALIARHVFDRLAGEPVIIMPGSAAGLLPMPLRAMFRLAPFGPAR